MKIAPLLLWIFILVPILEIYLLIQAGNAIGFWSTAGIIILTAIIGSYLLRIQGIYTVNKVQAAIARGQIPTKALIDGVLLLIGGILLLTPGFFTDSLGLLCLLPGPRDLISHFLSKRILASQLRQQNTGFNQAGFGQDNIHRHHTQPKNPHKTDEKKHVTIEGQYTKED